MALSEPRLLFEVLHIQEAFYRSGFGHFEKCRQGDLQLIPDSPLLDALKKDYQSMLDDDAQVQLNAAPVSVESFRTGFLHPPP